MVAPSSPTAVSLAAQSALRGLSPSRSINLSDIENTRAIATPFAQTTSATEVYHPHYANAWISEEVADLQPRGVCKTKTITITVHPTATVLEAPDPSQSRGARNSWSAFTTERPSLVGRDKLDKSTDDTDQLPPSVCEGSDEEFPQSHTQPASDVGRKGGRGGKGRGCTNLRYATVTQYKTDTVRYMPAPTTLTSEVPGQTTRDHERLVPVTTMTGGAGGGPRPFWRGA